MCNLTLETLQLLIEANDRRLNDLITERDLRYEQRHEASRDALQASTSGSRRSPNCRARW
jgi:hypothetical protein